MTNRGILLASAALLTLATVSASSAQSALPEPLAALEPAVQPVQPQRPAISVSPPIKLLWRMLSSKSQKEEIQAPPLDEPMALVPPPTVPPSASTPPATPAYVAPPALEQPKPVQTDKPKPKSTSSTASTKVIPIPRPRPTIAPAVAVVEEAAAQDRIDPEEITGAITKSQPASAPPPATTPETAEGALPAASPIKTAEAVENDGFLAGDPETLLGEEERLTPEPSLPESIAPPVPATAAPPAIPLPPSRPGDEPYELVRHLQVLQDQIAQGSVEALAAQRDLRTEIDKRFTAAAPTVWQDERNAAAAVTYVLSGGPPSILRELQKLDPKPAIDPDLVSGVLAYAEGKEAEANRYLAEIDVARMAPSMGAQLALAKSALTVRADPIAAMRLLDVARLLAPGTLAEEAALRREIFVADRLKDAAAIEELTRQYLTRFRNSIYAGNFRNRFASAISRMNFVKDEAGLSRIDDMLAMVEPEARGQLYLTVALAAVVNGNTDPGAFAADRALALAPRGSKEEARAQLYRAASLIADPKAFDAAVAAMGRSNRKLLGPSDQSLHDAVSATIAGIRSGTDVPARSKYVAALDGAKEDAIEMTPIMTKVRDAISATDELVEGAKK